MILGMLKQVLGEDGYDVECVPSAEAALSLLDTENILVFFLDLNLPGMNGIELCRRIKKETPLSGMHMMTGDPNMCELSDCREAGCDDYFVKPFEIQLIRDSAKHAFVKLQRWIKD